MSTTPPVGANPVTGAIRKAAQATGVGFDYLLATAKVESDLDPNLTMRSSTATGLFQFIEQTWLGTLKQAGPALGYGNYADAIHWTGKCLETVLKTIIDAKRWTRNPDLSRRACGSRAPAPDA